jgi:hypothetical protein
MVKKKRRNPPSRKRYERDNPVASCRVSREVYDRLLTIRKLEGRSMADILEAGLGLFEVKVKSEKEIWQQAFDAGEESGINRAEELYAIRYKCSGCGEEMFVSTDEEKTAIRRFIKEQGWGHKECVERMRRLQLGL